MADKELRRMNRAELIEIIYALQQRQTQLEEQNTALQQKLNERAIKLKEAGSLAEASLALNGVFEAAQAAAEQYLTSLRAQEADAAAEKQRMAEQTRRELDTLRAQARKQVQAAQVQADETVANANSQAQEILRKAKLQADALMRQTCLKADAEANATLARARRQATELLAKTGGAAQK